MSIPRFIDNCVVGVNECDKRPNTFVEPINHINDINIRGKAFMAFTIANSDYLF